MNSSNNEIGLIIRDLGEFLKDYGMAYDGNDISGLLKVCERANEIVGAQQQLELLLGTFLHDNYQTMSIALENNWSRIQASYLPGMVYDLPPQNHRVVIELGEYMQTQFGMNLIVHSDFRYCFANIQYGDISSAIQVLIIIRNDNTHIQFFRTSVTDSRGTSKFNSSNV